MEVIVLIIVAAALIFGRGLYCWYYKINERIELQKETNRLLKKIAGEQDPVIIEPKEVESKELDIEKFNKTRYG